MTEIIPFVRDALAAGKSRTEIRDVLAEASWRDDEIDDALSRFSEGTFPIPVPQRRASASPREAFLYLVTFLMLYTATISFGSLLSGYVDKLIPDPTQDAIEGSGYEADAVRWLVASLLVSFPTWFFLTRSHLVSFANNPERRTSAVRGWLTYLTLFVASSIILCTLVVLLSNALGGEFISRSILKCLVIIFLSGSVFGFYLWDMRRGEKKNRRLSGGTGLAVLGSLAWITFAVTIAMGMKSAGSPMEARREKQDLQRVSDLDQLRKAVRTYYVKNKALPEKQELAYGSLFVTPIDPKDPETEARYSYRIVDAKHFELGAVFKTDQSKPGSSWNPYSDSPFFKHGQGAKTFTFDAKSTNGL